MKPTERHYEHDESLPPKKYPRSIQWAYSQGRSRTDGSAAAIQARATLLQGNGTNKEQIPPDAEQDLLRGAIHQDMQPTVIATMCEQANSQVGVHVIVYRRNDGTFDYGFTNAETGAKLENQRQLRTELEQILRNPQFGTETRTDTRTGKKTTTPTVWSADSKKALRKSSTSSEVGILNLADIARLRAMGIRPSPQQISSEWADETATSPEQAQIMADRTGKKVYWARPATRNPGGVFSSAHGTAEPSK